MTCRACGKKSGWLLAVPVLFVLPKCPLCWLLYLAIFEAAIFSKAGAAVALVLALVAGVFVSRWIMRRPAISAVSRLRNYFAGSTSA